MLIIKTIFVCAISCHPYPLVSIKIKLDLRGLNPWQLVTPRVEEYAPSVPGTVCFLLLIFNKSSLDNQFSDCNLKQGQHLYITRILGTAQVKVKINSSSSV